MPQTEEPDDPDLSAWRQIVENYGERAELPPDEPDPWGAPSERAASSAVEPLEARPVTDASPGFDDDVDQPFDAYDDPAAPVEERFVPPEPEPLHLGPARTAAWAGVLGAPLVALLATIAVATGMTVPHWFGWLLVAAFLGGFAYLVLTMPRDRDDPWDDGARL